MGIATESVHSCNSKWAYAGQNFYGLESRSVSDYAICPVDAATGALTSQIVGSDADSRFSLIPSGLSPFVEERFLMPSPFL
jgi:hypothetical protein